MQNKANENTNKMPKSEFWRDFVIVVLNKMNYYENMKPDEVRQEQYLKKKSIRGSRIESKQNKIQDKWIDLMYHVLDEQNEEDYRSMKRQANAIKEMKDLKGAPK